MTATAQKTQQGAASDGDALLAQLAADRPRWMAYLRRRLPSSADAEDVLHQAYERAATRLHTLRDPAALSGWFYRVMQRLVVDLHTKRAIAEQRLQSLAHEVELDSPEETAACGCGLGLLNKLKPNYRDILMRVDMDDEPLAEVASELNLTLNNATVRLHRARRKLREEVEGMCGHGISAVRKACADCAC